MSRIRTFAGGIALAVVAGCDLADPTTAPPFGLRPHTLTASAVMVTSTNDDGPGSLRQAISEASFQGDATIQFDPSIAGQTITLASTLNILSQTVTIEGPVPGGIVISGGGLVRVMEAFPGARLVLRNVTITRGYIPGPAAGLAIDGNATVTLDHVTISGNRTAAALGTGLDEGAGISTIANSYLTITNSTISGNIAAGPGGGIYVRGAVTIINSTVAGNTASFGGGIVSSGANSSVRLRNAIVANSCDFAAGTASYAGTNVTTDASCGTDPAVIVGDPMLGPLAANGGPTKTLALLKGSPAIDAATECTVTDDQRYVARPQGLACDIGAVEFNDYVKVAIAIDPTVAVNPTTGVAILTGSMTCSAPGSITLDASLTQAQKNGRSTVVAQASAALVVNCTGAKSWSISLAPPTGAFQNGTGAATLKTSSADKYVAPTTATGSVKMYWGHK